MKSLSNPIATAFLFAISLLVTNPALSQPAPDYKYSPPAKLNDGIRTGTLSSAKLDEAKVSAGMNEVLRRAYGNIHSVLILRDGKLVCEEYFTGPDENNHKGEIGIVSHNRDTLHDLRSVTKSVVALSVLIAHSQGKIKDLDQPVFSFFPEYASHAQGEKKSITVRHALTMTSGLEWDESGSYSNPASSAVQMNSAANTIEFVLGRKLVNKPGTKFEYNGGMTQLLAAIIRKTTGSDIESFTKKHLLSPLGITKYEWAKLKPGQPDADSGLRLRSRDIAKIGLLFVNGGSWNGKRIVPKKLIAEAMAEHAKVSSDDKTGDVVTYGYQIWRFAFPPDENWPSGFVELSGNGGQKVVFDVTTRVLVVITAGNYDREDLKKNSFDIYPDIVFPALRDR
jgi:CubicO group peptidase (beta-lactamase class C family)